MKKMKTDVVVVGTGAAGLFAALSLKKTIKVLMITKDAVENSDSYLAQGGISTLLNEEDYKSYFEDTMKAGRYENNKESVKVMIQSSREIIHELIDYGVDFDRNPDGTLSYTREGAHSTFRILHHDDVTGKEITSKLIAAAKKSDNIQLMEYTTMIDLISNQNDCEGIVTEDRKGEKTAIFAKTVILATGGIGGLFTNSTNFSHITGDSFALALRHNIELENLQYIQIHPTVLYSKKPGRRFLISESVRGEGALLLNENKERFVDELLPRDVVTNAIKKQMDQDHTNHVYLSLNHMKEENIKKRFPNIYQRCLEEGYELGKDLVPVTPAQHYLMGGIKANTYGETSMQQLYAVGETACNGVHGANRLASNSLLESLVFAKRAAHLIGERIDEIRVDEAHPTFDQTVYEDDERRNRENRDLVMNEIKRRDGEFYATWCDNEN
ncbi:L-aspartate oxidase [Lachnospiraceae bacterium KM106-2]|nr:L-aspartate oxidase [Lachnospiraceae bacterium KM106-2]